MASQFPPSLSDTLAYFGRYDFPLTSTELWFWQHGTRYSKNKIQQTYNLQPTTHNFTLRKKRQKISLQKWTIARKVGESLKKIPFIAAVFVTGSLAMSNASQDADIDLMIVAHPHTLWLTRFLVYLLIGSARRPPGLPHTSPASSNTICDNLYLETNNLQLTTHNLYFAHEILQAKVLWDRAGVHRQLLQSNPWVAQYLPVAYSETLKKTKPTTNNSQLTTIFLYPLNLLFFIAQYLYMRPKITTEKITLHSAFFHPASS